MKGLVLAGGHGTRLRPLTFSGNKHMIPIANQPILFYGLKHLARAGIRDVAVVLGPIHEEIRETLGDGSALGLRIEYIHQGDPKGLAHAVLCAREYLGQDPFVMYLGDNLLQEGVEEFVRLHAAEHADAVVGVTTVEDPSRYGIVELDGDRVVSIEEKPASPRSNQALIGVYLFEPTIHPIIARLHPSRRGELEITEAIWKLVQAGGKVLPHRVSGWWKDTGKPEDLLEANELVLRSMPATAFESRGAIARGAALSPPVGLGPGTVVERNVEITGPVVVGAGAHLGEGSRIGPCTAIGNGVRITGAEIRGSIVMDGTLIEGPVRIAHSLIGRNVRVSKASPGGGEVSLTLGDAASVRL